MIEPYIDFAVMRGEIPVNKEISMEMNRIDELIANPGIYYDDEAVMGLSNSLRTN